MAVIDFKFRPRTRGYEEQISRQPIRTAEHIEAAVSVEEENWFRNNTRFIAHAAICIGVAYGSYQLFAFAKQLQYNLLVLVP